MHTHVRARTHPHCTLGSPPCGDALQVVVLQGSLEVLQNQLQAMRADLTTARSQQLADALAAQQLSRQVRQAYTRTHPHWLKPSCRNTWMHACMGTCLLSCMGIRMHRHLPAATHTHACTDTQSSAEVHATAA